MNRFLETALIAVGAVGAAAVGIHYYHLNKIKALQVGQTFSSIVSGQSHIFEVVQAPNLSTSTVLAVDTTTGIPQQVPFSNVSIVTGTG